MSPTVYAVVPTPPVDVESSFIAVPVPAANPVIVPVVEGCAGGVVLYAPKLPIILKLSVASSVEVPSKYRQWVPLDASPKSISA